MFKLAIVHVFGNEEGHLIALLPFFGLDVGSTDAHLIGIAKRELSELKGVTNVDLELYRYRVRRT